MAVTPGRWAFAALAGMAVMVLLILREPPDRPFGTTHRHALSSRATRTGARLLRAAEALHRATMHDSLRAELARRPAVEGRVLVDRAIPATMQPTLTDLVSRATRERRLRAVDMAFVLDTARAVHGVNRDVPRGVLALDYLLPARAGDRCVVVARLRVLGTVRARYQVSVRELRSDVAAQRLLGPCAFYEAFGSPGTHVDEWLRRGAWNLGHLADWEAEPRTLAPPPWVKTNMNWRELFQNMRPEGVACLADVARCPGPVATHPGHSSRYSLVDGAVQSGLFNPYVHAHAWWYGRYWNFGPYEWMMLADMVRSVGPRRFGEFWQSPLPPEDAFHSATGQTLSQWTHAWLRGVYRDLPRGPRPQAASIGWGLWLAAGGLALALRAAQRRRAT